MIVDRFAEQELVQEHQLHDKVVNEEFKIWKKTVPLLYDTIHSHALEYPALSVDWLPDYTVSDNKNAITVRFVFGTNTSRKGNDQLHVASLQLPSTLAADFSSFSSSDSIPVSIDTTPTFQVELSWLHPGEVNRLVVNEDRVLTLDGSGLVHLYDLGGAKSPVNYDYHKKEGYALEWLLHTLFASGAHDGQIAIWEVDKPLTPLRLIKSHGAAVNDVSVNRHQAALLGSVLDDYSLQVHDVRAPGEPAIVVEHGHAQNAVAFHPDLALVVATGGRDNVVQLWDLRATREPLRKLYGHTELVIGTKWDPANPAALVSWGLDNRVVTWDLNQLDEPFSYPESGEGKKKKSDDPALAFIHGGHTARVNDVAVHPKIPSLFASVGNDTLLEVFKPKTIVEE